MSWVKIDDQFTDNPKIAVLSDVAFRAYVSSICYASRNLTDGVVPMRKAKEFAGRVRIIQELIPGLWEPLPDGSLAIHDYLKYNPTRDQVLAEREIAKRRFAMNANPELARIVRARDGDSCRYCGTVINWADRKSPLGGTYDHVVPMIQGGPETIENLVSCCRRCNNRKGARSPEQAGMVLLPTPNQTDSRQKAKQNQAPYLDIPVPVPPVIGNVTLVESHLRDGQGLGSIGISGAQNFAPPKADTDLAAMVSSSERVLSPRIPRCSFCKEPMATEGYECHRPVVPEAPPARRR